MKHYITLIIAGIAFLAIALITFFKQTITNKTKRKSKNRITT